MQVTKGYLHVFVTMGEDGDPLKILSRGPDYLRARMLSRSSGGVLRRATQHVSAVEQLAASRTLYSRPHTQDTSHQHSRHIREETDRNNNASSDLEDEVDASESCTKLTMSSSGGGSVGRPAPTGTPKFPRSLSSTMPRRQDSLPIRQESLPRIHSLESDPRNKAETPGSSDGLSSDPGFLQRQSSFTRTRPKIPAIATMEYRETIQSGDSCSSDTDRKSNGSSHKLDAGSSSVVRRRHRKMMSRSRSDLTKRLSNSSDLSELGLRFSRNSADLERFFNEMGLEKDILQPMLNSQYATAQWPSVYESVSCIASPDNHSLCSDRSMDCYKSNRNLLSDDMRSLDTMSVVERNARIIKWLGGVKKAAGSASD